jgi:hypothetical protein
LTTARCARRAIVTFCLNQDEVAMRSPIRLLVVTTAVLLGAVQMAPAKTLRANGAPPPEAAPWCLHDHAGGVACYASFQDCMYAANVIKGNCRLSTPWRAKYGDNLPPRERQIYGGIPDRCLYPKDGQCY